MNGIKEGREFGEINELQSRSALRELQEKESERLMQKTGEGLGSTKAFLKELQGADVSFGKTVEERAKITEIKNDIKNGNEIAAKNDLKDLKKIREAEKKKKEEYRERLYGDKDKDKKNGSR